MKEIYCPICSAKAQLFVRTKDRMFSVNGTSSIFKCMYCGSLFIFPLPSTKELIKHYEQLDNSYYSFKISTIETFSVLERILKSIAHSRAIPRGNFIEGLKGERLLDIGCGTGNFLLKARPFFEEIIGIDVSEHVVRICRERGFKVYKGSYECVGFPQEFFDVITMFHVLEHVRNPYQFLQKAYSELKPRGTIVVGVPDVGGLPAKFFKSNWRGLDPPRHLFCFNEKSLKLLLFKSGFRINYVKRIPSGGENIRSMSIVISKKDPNIDASKIFRFLALLNDILMAPFSDFGINNFIEVRATKSL